MSEKKIKAIETNYAGCRFRSRLEARWAVFFDAMDIVWQYELEGYSLPSGAGYLPDFYLPGVGPGVHVEVKPNHQIPACDFGKMIEFVLVGDHNLLLLVDVPGQEEMYMLNRRTTAPLDEYEGDAEGLGQEVVAHWMEFWSSRAKVDFNKSPFHNHLVIVYSSPEPQMEDKMVSAMNKAKSARFEFGEKG